MTFDQWIDAVNAQVRGRLENQVRTEELSWDSAVWVGPAGTVTAALDNDEQTAKIYFDGGQKLAVAFNGADATPEKIGEQIAGRLASR